jgi:hypothetical protein
VSRPSSAACAATGAASARASTHETSLGMGASSGIARPLGGGPANMSLA